MTKSAHHVVPSPDGGWSVRRSGTIRASKHFDNKQDAVDWARNASQSKHSDLFIHGLDGTIQQKDSYGQDPYPPKGKDTISYEY